MPQSVIHRRGNEVGIIDLDAILLERRSWERVDARLHFRRVRQHRPHDRLIRLRQQRAPAIKHRGKLCTPCPFINKKSPIAVMPIKVAYQGVNDEHLPETATHNNRIDKLLAINRIKDIVKFRASSPRFRINNRILDRAEVKQPLAWDCKITASTNNSPLSVHIDTKSRLLHGNAQMTKDQATQVFAYAAVGIGQVIWPILRRGRKLEQPHRALERHSQLLPIGPIVGETWNARATREVNLVHESPFSNTCPANIPHAHA